MIKNEFSLSNKEKGFLINFEKYVEKIWVNYFSIALAFCVAIIGLYLGLSRQQDNGFVMALFFGGIGLNFYFLSNKYKKIYSIIKKLKNHIDFLEHKESEVDSNNKQ